jgi:hypothetical protein
VADEMCPKDLPRPIIERIVIRIGVVRGRRRVLHTIEMLHSIVDLFQLLRPVLPLPDERRIELPREAGRGVFARSGFSASCLAVRTHRFTSAGW